MSGQEHCLVRFVSWCGSGLLACTTTLLQPDGAAQVVRTDTPTHAPSFSFFLHLPILILLLLLQHYCRRFICPGLLVCSTCPNREGLARLARSNSCIPKKGRVNPCQDLLAIVFLKILYPYAAERRDVCTSQRSQRSKRFPEARGKSWHNWSNLCQLNRPGHPNYSVRHCNDHSFRI